MPLWVLLQFASCSFVGRLSINAAKLLLLLTLKQGNDSSIAQNAITPASFFCRPSGVLNGMKRNVVQTQWGKLVSLMGGWDVDQSILGDLSPLLKVTSYRVKDRWRDKWVTEDILQDDECVLVVLGAAVSEFQSENIHPGCVVTTRARLESIH